MATRRPFGPAFVFHVEPWFVAVDRLQPVALVLSADGTHTALTSWADLLPAPTVTPLRPRRVAAAADRVIVQDLPDGTPVTVTIDPDGRPRPSVEPVPARALSRATYPNLWSAAEPPTAPWSYRSVLVDDYTWTGRVAHTGAEDIAFPASILDFAHAGPVALACLLRADKRPWPFRRDTHLELLSVDAGRVSAQPVPNPDVRTLCWPSRFPGPAGEEALHEYLAHTLRDAATATDEGARDVELVLRNTLHDPEIELRFRHAGFPDREFRRLDRPFNELGNLGEGMRELHISLAEDIHFGLLDHRASVVGGPVVYC
jgi:hypothetical protein